MRICSHQQARTAHELNVNHWTRTNSRLSPTQFFYAFALGTLLVGHCVAQSPSESELQQLYAPDYAIDFDGVDDSFSFKSNSSLPDALYNSGTMTGWFKHRGVWENLDSQTLWGFGDLGGPSLSLVGAPHTNASTESSGVFRVLAQSSGSNCTDLLDESDLGLLWADQEWHFVAMSYDYARGLVSVYMDDRQHYSCDDQANAPIVDTLKREDPYDDPYIMVGNSDKPSDTAYTTAAVDGAFNGSMDDIRFYTVPLTEAQIDRVRRNSPAQPPTDIADSLYAWFNFATGAHTGDVQPVHNHGIRITTGQGINVYKPRFVVSDAPIPGLLQETTQTETETETESETQENEGESAVVLVQRRQAVDEGAPTAMRVVNGGQGMTVEFKIKFPYPEANFLYTVIEEPHASLNVTNAPDAGTFTVTADNGTASELDTVLPVQGLGTSLTFTPNASFYGNLSYTVRLTTALLSDGAGGNSSQPITLRIEIEQAVLPLLGSGGRAIRCDGVNDYMYAPYFEWPLQNYTDPTDNISRFGGGPITIEGWMYLSSDSSAYGTLASIGKGATPYRSYAQKMLYPGDTTGRLEFSMPTGSNRQNYNWNAGWTTTDHPSMSHNVKQYISTWVHFAATSTQVAGTEVKVFINGNLDTSASHNHDGVGKDSTGAMVKGLSICTSMFNAGVYLKGLVDEVRIWNYTRTAEEIKAAMHTSLLATDGTLHTQKAQGLVGYWNFDEADASIAIDLSGHGNHLHSAGCAVCDNTTLATQYYQGWAITPRSDYVCLPIALNSASDAYMGYEVHGGAHCYYSNSTYLTDDFPVPPTAEAISSQDIQQLYLTDPTTLQSAANSRRSTHPTRSLYRRQSALTAAEYEAMWTKLRRDQDWSAVPERVISTAPIGHYVFEQEGPYDYNCLEILLNITDLSAKGRAVRIGMGVSLGALYTDDYYRNKSAQRLMAGSELPHYTPGQQQVAVYYRPIMEEMELSRNWWELSIRNDTSPNNFTYEVSDGLRWSEPLQVRLFETYTCNDGFFIDRTNTTCQPCPVGTWVAGTTSRYNSTCVECAPNYFKADPGNAQCVLCPTGQYNDVYGSPKCDYCITDSVADATTNPSRGKFNLTNTCPYVIAQPNDAILLGPMWNTSSGESWTYDVISLPSNQTDGYLFDYEEGVPFVFDPLDSINHKLLSREYSVTTPFRFIKDEPGYPSYPPEDFTPGFYKDYPPQNIFGNPDQEFFRPYRYDGGEVSFIVDVSMPELNYTLNPPEDAAVLTTWYITDIWMFVQRDSANITGVDLYNYDDEQWYPVFRGSLGPMKGSFIDDTTYYTVVNFCRRDIKTNRLRLTFDTKSQTKESMGVSIDSFTAACYLEQRKKRYWTLTDPGARAWFVPLGNYSQQLFSKALQLAKYSCDGDGPWNESIQLQVNSVVLNEEGSISTPILATMIALVVACEVVLVLTFCGVMYYRHEHARLKKASPVFMMLMLVGGIISLPVPLIYLATEGSWGCYTGMCLWNCGFVITFGALFIKTYRIRMIFGSDIAKLKNSGASLGDNQLLQHLGGMFVVCSVGLSIYLALYPISRDSQILAGIEWQVCEVGPLQAILVGIQLAIMVLGAMLAYQVRSAPSDFSESKMIGLSIYNWVFITIVAIVTILATDSGVNVQLIIMTMYMVLVYMVVNCLMVVFKLWKVFRSEVQRLSNHNTSAAKDDSYNTRNHEASDRSGGDSIAQPSQRQLLPMSGPSGQGDRGSAGILHVKGVSEPINTDKQSSSGNFNSVMFTSSGGGLLSYPTAASSSSNGSLQRSNSNNATPNNTTGNTNSAATRKREYKRAAGVIKGPGSASINTAACVDDRCIVEADDVAEGASSDLTEV